MDDASELAALSLHLKDVQTLLDQCWQCEDSETNRTRRLTMGTYKQHLEQGMVSMCDRYMVPSIVLAGSSDTNVLAALRIEEQSSVTDRESARNIAEFPHDDRIV